MRLPIYTHQHLAIMLVTLTTNKNEHMKNIFLIIVLFFLSCGQSSLQPSNNRTQSDFRSSECRLPGAEIVAYDSFKVKLHVNEISFDSIIANVDFFNGTSDTLLLLKKILPSDSLKEGIFTLFKNVSGNYRERIEPIPVESNNKYAMGMQFPVWRKVVQISKRFFLAQASACAVH
jgi:hypothetical protein